MYTGKERRQAFELRPTDKKRSAKMVDKRRTIIGRAETCDIILDYPDIAPIHAILEITKDGNKIYDLNTKSGTFINGVKTLVGNYKEGDKIKFGGHEFEYKKFVKEEVPPPILQMLDPTLPEKLTPPPATIVTELPKLEKVKVPPKPAFIPRVAYPLNEDPNAVTSPFLLEESDTLFPIFVYEPHQSSVEVMLHFGETFLSLDYIPLKNGNYPIVGRAKNYNEIEVPVFGKKDKIEFLDISGGSVKVTKPLGFESLILHDQKTTEGPLYLKEDDLIRFYKNDLQILIRLAPKPPFVKRAPFLSKDNQFLKILGIVYVLILILLFIIALTTVNVEEIKEKELEKAPERIAKVLLHKPKPVIKEEPKVAETPVTPIQGPAKVTEIKKVEIEKEAPKPAPPKPPKKAEPVHGKEEVKKAIVTGKPSTKKGPPAPPKTKGPKAPPGTIIAKKHQGPVSTFSLGFKPNISSSLAKGEQVAAVSAAGGVEGAEIGVAGGVGAGGATTVKKAGISAGVGSLKGVAGGSLDSAEGVAGLSNKDSVYSVGMPGKTVVLGSIDPDVIRKILRDNIPLFSNCYQKELEGTGDISGLVKLNFLIGSSGSVTKASTTTSASIPDTVIGCVTKVLRGIQFPPPMGGGSVEVVQPLNLQPKRI